MSESYKKSDIMPQLFKTELDANDSTQQDPLGAIRQLQDGRKFRYVKVTGGAAVEGRMFKPAAVVAISAAATGGSSAENNVVTVAGASYTSNAYVGYYFQCATSGTGSVEPRKIVANTATTLTLEKPISTACSSDTAEIIPGPGVVTVTAIDDLEQACSGVAQNAITQNYYGWLQIQGFGSVLATTALTEGDAFTVGGGTTAGQAKDRGGADDQIYGTCIAAGGNNETSLAWFSIQD